MKREGKDETQAGADHRDAQRERGAFKAWARTNPSARHLCGGEPILSTDANGVYWSDVVDAMWEGWQARAALEQQPAPKNAALRRASAPSQMPIPKSRHEAWVMHTALVALYPDLAASAPEGWKLVPVEPTRLMLIEMMYPESPEEFEDALRRYRAMLGFAPSPHTEETKEKP